MENTVKVIEYLGLKCMVITQNDINYYNVSNWGKQVNKSRHDYSNWRKTKTAQDQINACKEESNLDEVILDKTNLNKQHRGMYVYDDLAVLIAMWIDNKFGIRVAKLVNEGIKRELHFKYGSIISEKNVQLKEKDDKIDNLIKEVREQRSIIENQTIEVREQRSVIEKQTSTIEEQKEDIAKLLENSGKLLNHAEESKKSFVDIKNLLHEMKSDYVPTKDWNVVCILKKDDDTYTTIRCLSTELNKRIKSRGLNRDDMIFRMETPNGVEFFTTFKSSPRIKQKIDTYRNDIKLKVGLEEFMEMLMEHKQRTELLIEETLNN
jgi:hypothetical protein